VDEDEKTALQVMLATCAGGTLGWATAKVLGDSAGKSSTVASTAGGVVTEDVGDDIRYMPLTYTE
jgi:hypothetical protein